MKRSDWKIIIQKPIGLIMGGSGCGIVTTICKLYNKERTPSIEDSVLYCVKGHTSKRDLTAIDCGNDRIYSILSFLWGFIADTDFESERLRWMGASRFPAIVY